MTPEFSRPIRLDAIGSGEHAEAVAADDAERAALAKRFDLLALDRLEATLTLRTEAAGVRVRGRVAADVAQPCGATGEPVPARIDEPVDLLFVAPGSDAGDEVELAEQDCDVVVHDGAAIDLGEAAAETMALALDPFPRSPEADTALKAAGVLGEGEAGPFGGLAALRDALKR